MLNPIEPRGVYVAQYTIDGCPVLYAVKSNGDRLKRIVVVRPPMTRETATEWMWDKLDQLDPVPQLMLVRDDPTPPPPPPESSTAYLMRRARKYQLEGRIRRLS